MSVAKTDVEEFQRDSLKTKMDQVGLRIKSDTLISFLPLVLASLFNIFMVLCTISSTQKFSQYFTQTTTWH